MTGRCFAVVSSAIPVHPHIAITLRCTDISSGIHQTHLRLNPVPIDLKDLRLVGLGQAVLLKRDSADQPRSSRCSASKYEYPLDLGVFYVSFIYLFSCLQLSYSYLVAITEGYFVLLIMRSPRFIRWHVLQVPSDPEQSMFFERTPNSGRQLITEQQLRDM